MRIAIVGPAHPYKGGIAQHTTELAHRLSAAGHEVELISWNRQYPFFYPGKQFVTDGKPELPRHAGTKRVLSWRNPVGWARWGRYLRSFDRLIFVWWVPTFQGPPYLSMLRALGRKRPPVTLVCHNVLPHENKPGDRQLTRAVLRRCERVIVHSEAQAKLVHKLSGRPAVTLTLPLALHEPRKLPARRGTSKQLLFFGFVRPYKGLDVLLKALARVPDVRLTIAGEFWGDANTYTELIKKLKISSRVTVHNEYVADDKLNDLIAAADAVVLPYKSGTGSTNASRAFTYDTPVIATKTGSIGAQVRDGVDGLLCKPNDIAALAGAIRRFYEPDVAERLRQGIPKVTTDADWQHYVDTVVAG